MLLNNQIVPEVVTERRQDFLPTPDQSRHYLRLRDITYRFTELANRSIHCEQQ